MPRPFRILSIDGGGVRGAFAASYLNKVEEKFGAPICDYFDLVAGTSTGGIIAAAVARKIAMARARDLYLNNAEKIFKRPIEATPGWLDFEHKTYNKLLKKYANIDYHNFGKAKYKSLVLIDVLKSVFGNAKIADIDSIRMLIPSVDLCKGSTVVFKTPHFPGLTRDREFLLVDVLRATTSAPTYFPHTVINPGSAYVDGGLWANNPSVVAIAEAMKIRDSVYKNTEDEYSFDEIHLLSIGVGKPNMYANPPGEHAGVYWWGGQIFNISSEAQSAGVEFQCKYLLGDRFTRIDFNLPNDTWSLDNASTVEQLVHRGEERFHETWRAIAEFFHTPAWYKYKAFE